MEREWQNRFERLTAEWRLAAPAEPPPSAETWPASFRRLLAEEEVLRKRGAWQRGGVDAFEVLGLSHRELFHSKMLAWLLDPCGRHGLGTALLERVLHVTFPNEKWTDLSLARTDCEVTVGEGRLDIVAQAKGLYLVIENKVEAIESEEQCDSYYSLLLGRTDARFIFLSPGGKAPKTATGEAAAAYRPLSYRQVRASLKAALDDTVAHEASAKARAVARDYLRTLERCFR